jgi:hypothetical protein
VKINQVNLKINLTEKNPQLETDMHNRNKTIELNRVCALMFLAFFWPTPGEAQKEDLDHLSVREFRAQFSEISSTEKRIVFDRILASERSDLVAEAYQFLLTRAVLQLDQMKDEELKFRHIVAILGKEWPGDKAMIGNDFITGIRYSVENWFQTNFPETIQGSEKREVLFYYFESVENRKHMADLMLKLKAGELLGTEFQGKLTAKYFDWFIGKTTTFDDRRSGEVRKENEIKVNSTLNPHGDATDNERQPKTDVPPLRQLQTPEETVDDNLNLLQIGVIVASVTTLLWILIKVKGKGDNT